MKKAKPGKRISAVKGKRASAKKTMAKSRTAAKSKGPSKKLAPKSAAPKTVAEYFAATPEPAHSALQEVREAIRSVVPPEATEIISYKIPAFKHKKVLVWYAAFSNHCSLFPTAAVIDMFKDELKGFSTSKGTIHFPLGKPMPVDLIKKMVKDRLGRTG
ncbi:MAG TPA: DUF1801 domain-containing protein [Candidatus Angelobacter sp.]|nr:DUF1801 domain-containing protein [Candidatus Angelobacter sp.]